MTSTGPTIKDGQMIDFSFSRCNVSSLPKCDASTESTEENDDAKLREGCPGDTAREEAAVRERR